jgi:hypothetical protein
MAVIFVVKEIPRHLRMARNAMNDTVVSENVFLFCLVSDRI